MNRAVAALVFTVVATTVTASCVGSGVGSLVGEYATEEGGRPEVRITKEQDQYLVSIWEDGDWSRPGVLRPSAETDYEELFGSTWEEIKPVGLQLQEGGLAMFKVEPGSTAQRHTFTTGYFFFFLLGGTDVHKL